MKTKTPKKSSRHDPEAITRAATLFFMMRSMVRTRLAAGRRLDPYAWLRIETLVHIRDNAGLSMKEVAAYLSITAPSATSLVNALAKSGMVERRTDPKDKRAFKVYLTRKGQTALKKAVGKGMDVFNGLFAPLSREELTTFAEVLERINKGA